MQPRNASGLPDGYEVVDTVHGTWIVLRHGFQVGGKPDHSLGCGTAQYGTREEAEQAARSDASTVL